MCETERKDSILKVFFEVLPVVPVCFLIGIILGVFVCLWESLLFWNIEGIIPLLRSYVLRGGSSGFLFGVFMLFVVVLVDRLTS